MHKNATKYNKTLSKWCKKPMMLGDADESMVVIDAGESTMVGEGAGESINPDLVVPTVVAN
jgi:hypothetical protein